MKESSKGVAALFFAYLIWGAIHPPYWKVLQHISSMEILMHRILWSAVSMALLITMRRGWRAFASEVRTKKREVLWLAAAGYIVALNWYFYIWAVNHGQVLSVSLAYFINPLMSMLFGFLFFGERMRGLQKAAIAIAVAGVAAQCLLVGSVPAVSLAIALTFAVYGVIKKRISISPEIGVLVESAFVAPAAFAWLCLAQRAGAAAFPYTTATNLLLAGTGVISAVPLLLFTFGTRRVPLATVGFLQFLSPFITFILGTLVYGEPMDGTRFLTFAVIWLALLLYTWDAFRLSGKGGKNMPRNV